MADSERLAAIETDLLNRICNLFDAPEYKELVAAHKRYLDAISAAYGVPEAIWHQSQSSGLALETIKEASDGR